MNYEIIASLGPSSESEPIWRELLAAGVTAFRLNTSHLTLDQLTIWSERLARFVSQCEDRPPVVLDLQGSKWRLGQFIPFDLAAGQQIELICGPSASTSEVLPVPHPDFFQAASASPGEIVLNDAKIHLLVETIKSSYLIARVIRGGKISSGKGITLPGSGFRKEALNEKDSAILNATRGLDFARYALSYVRDASEMARYRELIRPSAYLIAKLERGPALEEAQGIASHSDEVWLCRGDLGAELGLRKMAEAVNRFAMLPPGKLGIPVLMAGQVLEHMTEHSTPTRSEICYLYETIRNGYHGVVLSDETTIGRYPVEACRAAALFRRDI